MARTPATKTFPTEAPLVKVVGVDVAVIVVDTAADEAEDAVVVLFTIVVLLLLLEAEDDELEEDDDEEEEEDEEVEVEVAELLEEVAVGVVNVEMIPFPLMG